MARISMVFLGIPEMARLDHKARSMTKSQKMAVLAAIDGRTKRFVIGRGCIGGFYAATMIDGNVITEFDKTASAAVIKLTGKMIDQDTGRMPLISLESALAGNDQKRVA